MKTLVRWRACPVWFESSLFCWLATTSKGRQLEYGHDHSWSLVIWLIISHNNLELLNIRFKYAKISLVASFIRTSLDRWTHIPYVTYKDLKSLALWSGPKKLFLKLFFYPNLGVAAILVMWPGPYIYIHVVSSKGCSIKHRLAFCFLRKIYDWIWWWQSNMRTIFGPKQGNKWFSHKAWK